MNLPNNNKLVDALRQGRWTATEEAELEVHLAKHPDQRQLWEDELGLNQLLGTLPDHPISSNFTSRVLGAARAHAQNSRTRPSFSYPWSKAVWGGWAPKLAV